MWVGSAFGRSGTLCGDTGKGGSTNEWKTVECNPATAASNFVTILIDSSADRDDLTVCEVHVTVVGCDPGLYLDGRVCKTCPGACPHRSVTGCGAGLCRRFSLT